MKEKAIIFFVAVLFGLLATTVGFYIYESARKLPQTENKSIVSKKPEKAEKANLFLNIDEPKNESVAAIRIIRVTGVTNQGNTVIISSPGDDSIIEPAQDGKFSSSITIDTDVNKLIIRSIAPDGQEIKKELLITYSTEDF